MADWGDSDGIGPEDFDAIDRIEREYLKKRPKRIILLVDEHHTRWALEDDDPDVEDPFHSAWKLVIDNPFLVPFGHVVTRVVRLHLLQAEEQERVEASTVPLSVREDNRCSEVDPTS